MTRLDWLRCNNTAYRPVKQAVELLTRSALHGTFDLDLNTRLDCDLRV